MTERETRISRHAGLRPDWLAQHAEPVLEAELPIVDPHHHLWDMPATRYLLPELLDDTGSGHDIRATVFIDCLAFYRAGGAPEIRPVGETEFANGVAAMAASGRYGETLACAGIVSFADLTLGARVEQVLAAHVAAGNGRFRGIRHAAGWDASEAIYNSHTEPPEGLYREPRFREGFAQLARFDLGFEAWLYQPQLADVTDLARAFPEQRIVLNHAGGIIGIGPYADRHDAQFPAWRSAIREIAACPNVFVKLGGLGMKLCGFGFHHRESPPDSQTLAQIWRPYIETCIDAFGPKRAMFESNFPVDKHSCSYAVLWNAFKRLAAGASAEEKAALFHDTAAGFYRLDLPGRTGERVGS